MEFALQRITNCINNKSTELILSNLNLDYLPNNLPSSLQTLYCSHNQIKELNNLPSSLQTLDCSNNQIKELNNFPSSLQTLFCDNNQIIELNKLPSSLQTLYCYNNQIKELNKLPSSLQSLYCNNNQYLHITKSIAIRFNLKETPNYDEMARKIQRIYKYKKRQKRRKFCEELEHHAMEFRLRPMYPEYFVIKNKYKNIFSDC